MAEATLRDVIQELQRGREVTESTTEEITELHNVVNRFLNILNTRDERNQLNEEENRRERSRTSSSGFFDTLNNKSTLDEVKGFTGGVWDLVKSIVSGNLLSGLIKNLVGFIFRPIAFIGRVLLRNGSLALAVSGLYLIFKDIGNNPAFQKAIAKLSQVWHEKVLPMFKLIKDTIVAIGSSEELVGALGVIQKIWKSVSYYWSNVLVPVFQKTFIGMIDNLSNLLGGISDSITLIINGEWKQGILTFVKSIGSFILNSVDTVLTGIFELLGVDFGPDGSLFTTITNFGKNIIQWFKDGFAIIGNFFLVEIPRWFNETTAFISAKFWEIIDGVKTTVSSAFFGFTDLITGAITSIKDKFTEIIDGFKGMIDYIVGIPGRVKEYILSILPDWMKSDNNYEILQDEAIKKIVSTGVFNQTDVKTLGMRAVASAMSEANSTTKPLSSESSKIISDYLATPAPNTGNNVIVATDNRTSTSVNNSSTNIVGFGSPMNEYSPQ